MENKTGKVDAKELAKELLVDRRHGSARVEEEEMKKSQRFCEGDKAFLSAAKTERESVDFAVEAAEKAISDLGDEIESKIKYIMKRIDKTLF